MYAWAVNLGQFKAGHCSKHNGSATSFPTNCTDSSKWPARDANAISASLASLLDRMAYTSPHASLGG